MKTVKIVTLALALGLTGSMGFANPPHQASTAPTTKIVCSFYSEHYAKDVEVEASFSSKMSPSSAKTEIFDHHEVTLASSGGDGGEPGSVVLIVKSKGKMVVKTMWQVGDDLSLAGRKTGLTYVNESKMAPGGAELQYSCVSK